MSRFLIILLTAVTAYASRVSEWSATFTLRESMVSVHASPILKAKSLPASFSVAPNSGSGFVAFSVSGIFGMDHFTIRIFEMNGRLVQTLSGTATNGRSSVIWKTPARTTGLFFATLQSGKDTRNIHFLIFK